jgi:hypothetical protein
MHAVVETPQYISDVRSAKLSAEEAEGIVLTLAQNPTTGVIIPDSGGARKVRFRGRGKGKSGGYRVITFWGGVDIPVFLLALYAKNERADLSAKERAELRKYLTALPSAYRAGARRHGQGKKQDD